MTPVATAAGEAAVNRAFRVLDDKLRVPQLSIDVLRRGRVTGLIEQAASHPVTVITAPAGAGKTIACATWATAAARSRRIAWLNLDEGDRDPAKFWAYVTSALAVGSAVPPVPAAPLVPRSRPGPDDLPVDLVDAVRDLAGPITLILDDLHNLADSDVLPGLGFLVHHAPPALRLILCGRSAPGLGLAKMRVTGELAELGAADLACTAEEADAYFGTLGLAAGTAERDELLRYTEGWMTGLRLAALTAGRGRGPSADAIGADPIVADYLRDEVLDQLPAETQLFMRRTSVAEPLTGEFADWLTAGAGGARVLDRLNRQNSFVDQLPGDGGRYRYHPFMRDMLRAELRRQMPREVPVLYGRAARWYAARGEAVEAVRCSAEAADWPYASQALAEAGIAGLLPDRAAELEALLSRFPASRRAGDAVVAAALAAARLCDGDPGSATAYLDSAERAVEDCDEDTRPVIELWLAALRVMKAADQPAGGFGPPPGTLNQAWTEADKAQASAGTLPVHRALGLLWLALGTALFRRWEIADARHALGHAEHQLAAAGLGTLRTRARAWQALAEAFYGDLGETDKILAELRGGFHANPAAECLGTLATAQLALERDDLVSAAGLLDEADVAAVHRLPGEPDAAQMRTLIRVRAALAAGDTSGAGAQVTLLREAGLDPSLLAVLDADIALRAGDVPLAATTLESADEQPDRADQILAHARLLLADGDPAGALKAADRCLDGAASGITTRDHVTALLAATVANRRLGAVGTAAGLLEQAMAIAEPHGAYRPFLDAGAAVHSAIAVLVPPVSRGAAFAARVRERFVCQLPAAGTGPGRGPGAAEQVALTDSELAVLRFLPSYLTNQEIAEALFLSVNTVKTHLRSAYHKLGVTSRREAIARGRRLQLL